MLPPPPLARFICAGNPISNTRGARADPGRAISDTELDKQCEAYLAQRFGQRLDFDISGSLRSLLLDGVVWRDSQVPPTLGARGARCLPPGTSLDGSNST